MSQKVCQNVKITGSVTSASCLKCKLHDHADHPFASTYWFSGQKLMTGVPPLEVLEKRSDWLVVLGEPPSSGYNDTGDAGEWKSLQKSMLLWYDLDILDRIIFIPVVRCYPPHEDGRPKITHAQLGHCMKINYEVIKEVKPKAIFAVGFDACRALTKRGDDFNLAGRVYHWEMKKDDESATYTVIPVWGWNYVNRDAGRFQKPYVKQWRKAIDLIDSTDDLAEIKAEIDYVTALDAAAIDEWFEGLDLNLPFGFDVETTSLTHLNTWDKNFDITCASFAHPDREKPLIIPLNYPLINAVLDEAGVPYNSWPARLKGIIAKLKEKLENPRIKKIGHNIKFDIEAVYRVFNIILKGVFQDTLLLNYALHPDVKRLNKLDDLIRKYLPHLADYSLTLQMFFDEHPEINNEYSRLPHHILFPYAALDTKVLFPILQFLSEEIEKRESKGDPYFVRLDGKITAFPTYSISDYVSYCRRCHLLFTTELEKNGVALDKEMLTRIEKHYKDELKGISDELNSHKTVVSFQSEFLPEFLSKTKAGKPKKVKRTTINWGSPTQVAALFYQFCGYPVYYETDAGNPSTDEASLRKLSTHEKSEVAKLLLKYRESSKFVDGFISKLTTDEPTENLISTWDGRVHASFNISDAGTGRLTCCVDGNTLLDTKYGAKKISEVSIGDLVLTHRGRYRPIRDVYIKGFQEMFEVETENGNRITCTKDHKFYTPTGWRSLKQLANKGDIAVFRDCGVENHEAGNSRQEHGDVKKRFRAEVPKREMECIQVQECRGDHKHYPHFGKVFQPISRRVEAKEKVQTAKTQRDKPCYTNFTTSSNSVRTFVEGLAHQQRLFGRSRSKGDEYYSLVCNAKSTSLWHRHQRGVQVTMVKGIRASLTNRLGQLVTGTGGVSKKLHRRPIQFFRQTLRPALKPNDCLKGCQEVCQEIRLSQKERNNSKVTYLLESQPSRGRTLTSFAEQGYPTHTPILLGQGVGRFPHRQPFGSGSGWELPQNTRSHHSLRHKKGGNTCGEEDTPAPVYLRGGLEEPTTGCQYHTAKIKRVVKAGIRLVWDVHVEEDHSYSAQGFLNHNSKPNMQQIPVGGHVKRVYCSRYEEGWLLQRDYSQLEVRVLALMSRDATLINAFLNNEDVHLKTQKFFFGSAADKNNKPQRVICKGALFGRIYGQGDKGLFENLSSNDVKSPTTGEPITMEECHNFNQLLDESYPGMKRWVEEAQLQGIEGGVSTAFGFVRPLANLASYARWIELKRSNPDSARTKLLGNDIQGDMRKAQNTPIQGTAADLCIFAATKAMFGLREVAKDVKLCNLVHDSIWADAKNVEDAYLADRVLKDTMDYTQDWLHELLPDYDASWIDIPIIGECEIGLNAKDTFVVHTEPSLKTGETRMLLKVPVDVAEAIHVSGDTVLEDGKPFVLVDFMKYNDNIRGYLITKRNTL